MKYKQIVRHYESCFEKHGDTAKGVDWTRNEQVDIRYQTMLELINFTEKTFQLSKDISLLDFGCGLSHLFEYIQKKNIRGINYTGLDISEQFYQASKRKFPNNHYLYGDILLDDSVISQNYDYIIMNGVFTEKLSLSYIEMFAFFKRMITRVYPYCSKGLAFNVMSKQVDWEKDNLFHVPFDEMSTFLTKNISRNFIIRNDYGLYEYTVYLLKLV